jgi:L-lactate dehydrogenase (cytochrome)
MVQMVDTLRSVVQFRKPELDPITRRLRHAANVNDLRRIAKRRLPRGVFDYIDGAAEDERSIKANAEAFGTLGFKPRVMRDVSNVDTSVTVLGRKWNMPVACGPTGFTRIAHSQGELAVARAAARAGVPYTLSTMGTRSIEEVAAVSNGPKWFQVYVWRDRGLVKSWLDRSAACGYEAIMVTADTAVLGRRERDARRGFTLPPKIGPGTIVDGIVHPGWTWDFIRAEPIVFSNLLGATFSDNTSASGGTAVGLAEFSNKQFDPSMTWGEIDWLRANWNGPIVVKGIQTVADARLAVEAGVDAIVLSNHGGRQLDTSPAPLTLVAPTVDAVGDKIEVLVDSGVRRGADVVKAVALGAKACLVGRAYLFGLGAAGERGVDQVLNGFATDIYRTMALLGVTSTAELSRDLLAGVPPTN